MIRRPPRSTLFPLHDALPIFHACGGSVKEEGLPLFVFRDGRRQGQCSLPGREGTTVAPDLLPSLPARPTEMPEDRKSTRLNSSHLVISYAVFCLKKKHTHQFR